MTPGSASALRLVPKSPPDSGSRPAANAASAARILVADDHRLVREGLVSLLSQGAGLDVVAAADSEDTALQAVARCSPNVVVLDVAISSMSGLDLVQRIKRMWPRVGVLILTSAADDRLAIRCLRSGADGYLTHDCGRDELREAILKIAQGGKYVTENLADQLAASLQETNKPAHDTLSDREYQVMCLIAEGFAPTKIAERLGLSVKTVSTYRTRLLRKLDLETSSEVMRYAMANRLVP